MSTLMFTCPETKQQFSSHIRTDQRSMEKVLNLRVTAVCPICRKPHETTVKHGALVEDEEKRFEACARIAAKRAQPRRQKRSLHYPK